MKYNFDEVTNRIGTNSLKWQVSQNELPMWVADMDFKTAPEIIEAIKKHADHGIFGYTVIPDEWYTAYINWWKKRHDFEMKKEWLLFSSGVIPTISSTVRKLTTPNENIVIQTPVYNIFFNSIINNGRHVLESPLIYKNGEYNVDFNELEEKLANPQTTMMILCNPQNPLGKIWDRETLKKIGDLAYKYNVIVVSDEIHCDITDPKKSYIPFASVSEKCRENSIMCIAPTKCFNIAGIQTSAICISNKFLRHKVWRAINTDEVAEPNSFAIDAAISAFNNGGEWLDELCEVIYRNKNIANEFISKNIPQIKVVPSEATYLLWLDCSKVGIPSDILAKRIRKKSGLYLSNGVQYGGNGKDFLRINIACPLVTLKEGLTRLKSAIEMILSEKDNL